ncbi:hypothetical protein DV517_62020 [Streptomyces sp. S816]|uniref:hypothetical protein n=1 Tax=Streptomyces sp. S816 TaxID=2283197 RepID=UPI00109D7DBB|nr:hypothetical protein [Streptomyces sp. S816]TGZ14719.1 hypothetical protein DV517_62020 [Streptomyces sp. S816]
MSWLDKLLGNDRDLAETKYADAESASDRASRLRREKHRARVYRDGDNAGTRIPRRHRRHDNGSWN